MIISLLYIFLSLLSVQCYQKKDFKRFIIILTVIVYKGFGFISLFFPTYGDPNTYNFLLITIVLLIILNFRNKRILFNIKKDNIAKTIIWILVYQLLITIVTGISGIDSWVNAIGQYRFGLVLLLYFILRPIPSSIYLQLIPTLFKVLSVVIICYISLSIIEIIDKNPFKNIVFVFAPIALFFILFEKLPRILKRHKKVIIIIISVGIFSLLARGLFIAIIASITFYLFKHERIQKIILPLIIVGIMTPPIMTVIDDKKNESYGSNNLSDELSMIKESKDYSDFSVSSGALRYISVLERCDYMVSHPINMMFGIGVMKESTAQKKLSFISGTHGMLEEGGERVILQLDTDDVGLISSFMRFGLCYVFLFFILCRNSFKRFFQLNNKPLMKTAYLTLSMMLFAIPFTSFFFADWTLFPLLILMALSGNYTIYNNKSYAII